MPWEKLANLENWVKKRYLILEKTFGPNQFTLQEAEEALRKAGIETGSVKELLSILVKNGLVQVSRDSRDRRVSVYQLIYPKEREITRDRLFRIMKAAADLIRGGVDYKVLLVFLFYKAVSDKWMERVKKNLAEGMTLTQAYMLANREYMVLYDEDEQKPLFWHEVTKKRETLQEMTNALMKIAKLNPGMEGLAVLVEKLGLAGFINEDNMHIIEGIIRMLSELDFSRVDYDLLGEAYQWTLSYFASQKAKAGEQFTPREVVRLLVNLLDIENGTSVLDPALGSGGMLIESFKHVANKVLSEGGDYSDIDMEFYGQELNDDTAMLAKLNMILNNIMNNSEISVNVEIYIGDSLVNPQFPEADYVLTNPPWNRDGYNEETLSRDPRLRKIYRYGYPPNSTADWAWIQLIIAYAKRKAGIVIDQGALFRGGREKNIRKKIVEEDLIEAIILLPEKLFYNTQAPGVIIIFNKNKSRERKGKILFINASQLYEKHPEIRRLNRLGEKHIEKIIEVYREFKEEPGLSHIATLREVRENDYNLNVTLYVTPLIEMEEIDLEQELNELLEISKQAEEAKAKAIQYIQQIIQASKQR